jgi:hypothetical protein
MILATKLGESDEMKWRNIRPVQPFFLLFSIFASAGCMTAPAEKPPAVMVAARTAEPITLDGQLDEAVWSSAAAYSLTLSEDRSANGQKLQEGGHVRLAWDEKNLYVAFELEDSDVVAEGVENQLHHYGFGDVSEVFLRPAKSTWYWEFYATPHGLKTEFFFPGRGRLGIPSSFEDFTGNLRVAGNVDGTFNDWKNRDRGWSSEFAIPVADITQYGDAFGPGSEWRVLFGRYNYSLYFDEVENSAAPTIPQTDFHALPHYAVLKFE